MSVAYGGPTGGYAPPGRVNFGWINEAFELFKANAVVWIVAVLTLFLVPMIIGGIIGLIAGASGAAVVNSSGGNSPVARTNIFSPVGLSPGLSLLIRVVSIVYTAFIYGGLFSIAVKQVRGEPISVADIFSGGPLFLRMLGFNIVFGLAVGIGLVLLIVPGFLVIGLLLPAFALIADGETVSGAILRSVEGMKRDMWAAAGVALVLGLILVVSALPCGLGLLATYPMLWLVSALAYRDMIGMPGLGAPASPYGAAPYGTPPPPGVWPPPPGQMPPPVQPPSFGQPPPADPPRRTLGGDPMNDDGNTPPPNPPPGGTPPR